MGQLICVAAVADDVMSLILLAEIQALQDESPSAWRIIFPLLGSLASIALGLGFVYLVKTLYLNRVAEEYRAKHPKQSLALLLVLAVFLSWIAALLRSSALLGCFLAGLAFAGDKTIQSEWKKQTKRIQAWLVRLFFAATIAFQIPPLQDEGSMFQATSIGGGLLLTVAAVLGKLCTGVVATPYSWMTFWSVGFAMNGRGEFSFLIATEAASKGLLSVTDGSFASVAWALCLSILLAPIAFRFVLYKNTSTTTNKSSSDSHQLEMQPI